MKTIATIAQAKTAAPGVYSVKNAEGVGFKKQGEADGGGCFTLRFWLGDRRPTMSLGPPGDFESIKDVRDAADAARKLARSGVNPIEARKREKAANLASPPSNRSLPAEGRGGARCLHADAEAQVRRWELVQSNQAACIPAHWRASNQRY